MANIFISYRRENAAAHAGRLCDRLTHLLGEDRVFMDVQDIQPGEDFVQSIERTIAAADVVLAVIGPAWLESLRAKASAGEDFVYQELASALRRGTRVIPVLVNGAQMPSRADLPPQLAGLAHLNAVEIRDARFEDDVRQLTRALGRTQSKSIGAPVVLAVGVVAALLIAAAAFYFLPRGPRMESAVLTGEWMAEMRKPGQQPYRIRLNLVEAEGRVSGVVAYPTGDAVIQEGQRQGAKLRFVTIHTPQFASEPATIRYEGELQAESLLLTSVDTNGVASGKATRVPR